MYLWKRWRESRITFCAALAVIAVMLVAVLHSHQVVTGNSDGNDARQVAGVIVVFFYVQILPLGFFAWLLGSFGIGRDMGDGAASYLFTRPRPRAYFLWADWLTGAAQVITVVVLTNLVIGITIHRLLLAMDAPGGGTLLVLGQAGTFSLYAVMTYSAIGGLLIAGLIFSVTYATTVVVRQARGVILSLGLFAGYLVAGAIVHHYWGAINFPSLVLHAFDGHGWNAGLAWEIAARSCLILLFPAIAQFTLQRADL